MNASILHLLVFIGFGVMGICGTFVAVTYDAETTSFNFHTGPVASPVAWATFNNEVNQTGWSYLEVSTNVHYEDAIQAYAAGLAEGFLTRDFIAMHWRNTMDGYCSSETSYCQKLGNYLDKNMQWMASQIETSKDKDPFWYQVKLYLTQINGLQDGYLNTTASPSYIVKKIFDLYLMQINGDLEDLEEAFQRVDKKRVLGSGSCSALIKLLPDNDDLYVSQVTWNTYQSMLRILKKYSLAYRASSEQTGIIPGTTMTFSSYPGLLTSGDDFYVISSGLASQETTIGNSNASLWQYVQPTNSVLEGARSMIANRLASTGQQWASLFSKYNSGTYNNQWMVVDYKLFERRRPLPKSGLLYIIEQIPGMIVSEDMTSFLTANTYWPSYNVPYFTIIFNMSGIPPLVVKYGDWFTYERTARALIYKRDHHSVTDMESMIKLMRYNDYQHDPYSACNCTPPYSAENAISARSDLNPTDGTYPFPALSHRAHGATDMKCTSAALFSELQFVSVSGPTYSDVPPFQWSQSDFKDNLSHVGHPDLFMFKPIVHKWGK